MKKLLTAALLLLLAIKLAVALPIWSGYSYPSTNGFTGGSVTCSPVCSSASVSWVIPTISYSGSGSNEAVLQWLGIAGTNNATCGSNASCLGQFGTQTTVTTGGSVSCFGWWELLGPGGGYTNIGAGFPCAGGDVMVATMTCATNCTPYSASQTWNVTLQNVTESWTFNNSGTAFNWPLGQAWVYAMAEVGGNYSGCGSPCQIPVANNVLFSNFTVNGLPAVITSAMLQKAYTYLSGAFRYTAPSGPFGNVNSGGNNFNVCFNATGSGTYPQCPNASYSGSAVGVGP